jgi:argininosuccinate lyase
MIHLDDRHVSGSSIMPQKRNPDFAEVIRGKAAWVAGMAGGLLGVAKGGMSGYNRDTQITKYAVLDVVRECRAAPVVMRAVLEGLTVNADAMREKLSQGFLAAADFADLLARRLGLPFRTAYDIAALAVKHSSPSGTITEPAARQALRESGQSDTQLRDVLADLGDPSRVLGWRRHTGAPSPESMTRQVASLRAEAERLAAFIPEQKARIEAAWRRCREVR